MILLMYFFIDIYSNLFYAGPTCASGPVIYKTGAMNPAHKATRELVWTASVTSGTMNPAHKAARELVWIQDRPGQSARGRPSAPSRREVRWPPVAQVRYLRVGVVGHGQCEPAAEVGAVVATPQPVVGLNRLPLKLGKLQNAAGRPRRAPAPCGWPDSPAGCVRRV